MERKYDSLSERTLELETRAFSGTGGVSTDNRRYGFRPAFLDCQTDRIYPSCFANGCPAPFHLLDGLPDEVVLTRGDHGRVAAVKADLVSGFVFEERFYTREEAAAMVLELDRGANRESVSWCEFGFAAA